MLHASRVLFQQRGNHKGITIRCVVDDSDFTIGTRINKGERSRCAHTLAPPAHTRSGKTTTSNKTYQIITCMRARVYSSAIGGTFRRRSSTTRSDMTYMGQRYIDNFFSLLFDKGFGSDNNDMLL